MHGIENFFFWIADGIRSVWRARAALNRPTLFDDAPKSARSRFLMTLFCLAATIALLALAAVPVLLIWWAFTIHERQ